MGKLKSPLDESEYAKINRFFNLNKKSIHKPNGKNDLKEFIQKNGIFLNCITDLKESEKVLAWIYLRNLVLNGDSQNTVSTKAARWSMKEKFGLVNLVVIICALSFVVYKCSTSEPKQKVKSDAAYMTDCQNMIKREAKYPSSIDHKPFSTSVHRAPNGNIAVIAPFTAKNGFGLELEHTAKCIFTKDGQQEISIGN